MIGLSFEISEECANWERVLYEILNGMNVSKYEWEVLFDQILCYNNKNELQGSMFEKNRLTGEEFKQSIERERYYMIFVEIKAYPIGSQHDEARTVKAFQEGNCQFAIVCADTYEAEIYSKDEKDLEIIYNNCINNHFPRIQPIEEDVDPNKLIEWQRTIYEDKAIKF